MEDCGGGGGGWDLRAAMRHCALVVLTCSDFKLKRCLRVSESRSVFMAVEDVTFAQPKLKCSRHFACVIIRARLSHRRRLSEQAT